MTVLKTLGKNGSYVASQARAVLGSASSLVKAVSLVLTIGYLQTLVWEADLYLGVTPGLLLPPALRLWTPLTYCFLELRLWEVLVDVLAVGLCGKLIEPLWGRLEMTLYFLAVNAGAGLLGAVFYYTLYAVTSDTDLLFGVHLHGLAGYIAALSVAVKQTMPDHVVLKTRVGTVANRHVPLGLVLLSTLLYCGGVLPGTHPVLSTSGLLVGWLYLRFYQIHTNGTRGDMADSFSFASFFPNVIQPGISVICNSIHSGLVRVGVCPRVVRRYDLAAAASPLSVTLPPDPHDMERRRQMALKALSERLNKSDASSSGGKSAGKSSKKQQQQIVGPGSSSGGVVIGSVGSPPDVVIQMTPPSNDPQQMA